MPEQAKVEDLMKLPSVGERTAEILQNEGYGSFEELSTANPMDIHRDCNIVLSSATHIISASVQHLNGTCPDCESDGINNEWQEYSGAIPDDAEAEVVCEDCGWYGKIDDL